MPKGYAYILADKDNRFIYIGVTNSLRRRIFEHRNHLVPGYSKRYHIIKLVYYKEFLKMGDAIRWEKKMKNLVRRKKEKLIKEFNPGCEDLYISICK